MRINDVPDDVVVIYPRHRGDKFVLVEDAIVITEPGNREIIATLPVQGRYHDRNCRQWGRIRLSTDERRTIRTIIMREPSCRYEPRIGSELLTLVAAPSGVILTSEGARPSCLSASRVPAYSDPVVLVKPMR